jgi:hypothetical protein
MPERTLVPPAVTALLPITAADGVERIDPDRGRDAFDRWIVE